MSKFQIQFKEGIKSSNRLGNLIENPYKVFAASKMSNSVKPLSVVEFTDIFGKKHIIKCANKSKIKEAMVFLSMFKQETNTLKNILSEYPISMGRIPKKFMKELRSELKPLGFSNEFINKVAGY